MSQLTSPASMNIQQRVGVIAGAAAQGAQLGGVPRETPEVDRELNVLDDANQRLDIARGKLVTRLRPVMGPDQIAACSGATESATVSPLGSTIRHQRVRIEESVACVEAVLASLAI